MWPHLSLSFKNNLKVLNIVRDVKGQGKERLDVYSELIVLLEQGTEPITY